MTDTTGTLMTTVRSSYPPTTVKLFTVPWVYLGKLFNPDCSVDPLASAPGGGWRWLSSEDQSTVDALISERRTKRDALRSLGIDPYPMRFDRSDTAAELHERYTYLAADTRTGTQVQVAGRVGSIRGHGKLVFVTLVEMSGSIQLLMSASQLDPAAMEVRDRLDLGDWLGASGEVVTSRRGELSVDVTQPHAVVQGVAPPTRQMARAERR